MTSIATSQALSDPNTGWVLSAPESAPVKQFAPPPRLDPVKRAAMKAYAAGVLAERHRQGLSADGRILDMAAYDRYLRGEA